MAKAVIQRLEALAAMAPPDDQDQYQEEVRWLRDLQQLPRQD